MRYFVVLIIFCSLFVSQSFAAQNTFTPSKRACAGLDTDINKIHSRMRISYTTAQGERFKERLRTLKANRRICKAEGFSVK